MKKKLLSFLALTVIGVLAFAATQATQASRRAVAIIDISIDATDITDGDISAALSAKIAALGESETVKVGNITINLDKDVAYKVTAPIEAPASLTINGNGATISASEFTGEGIVKMASTDPVPTDVVAVSEVTFDKVTVAGLKNALFYSTQKQYLLNALNIKNSVIELAGDATTLDFTKGSSAKLVNIENSTIYAPTATTKSFFSSQSGQKVIELDAEATQTFQVKNSTMYNLAPGKNFFSHRQANQTHLVFTVQNSIFVNCGKSGQVIKGMNGGQSGKNPTWDIDHNSFNYDDADTSASEDTGDTTEGEGVKNNVEGVVVFADASNGDFTLGTDCAQYTAKIGDSRWIKYPVTIAGITNGTVSVDKTTAAEGDEVTITATPNDGYKVKSITVTDADEQAVTVTNGKFTMPAKAVTVNAKFNQSVDVTISPASGDISEAIKAELGENDAKNLTINLAENGAYTLSGTIKAGGNVTINGNGSTIDASTGDNIVGIDGVAGFAKKADETDSDHSLVNAITFKDVTITGMQKALVRDLMTKTLLETLTIDNCVMQASNAKPLIDFDGRGYVGKVVVKNSTIWSAAPTDKNFAKYGSRPKNVNEALNQEFDIQNSTIVNIAAKADFSSGQNFNNFNQKGTANNIYTLKNNIFVNCGKSGQVVMGFNSGQASPTPVWDVDKNAFNWNGADVSATEIEKAGKKGEEDIVKNNVAGVVIFADAANGDFTLGECAQYTAETGDPRWISAKTPKDVTIAATDITDGDITAAVSAAEDALAYNETIGNITITLDKAVAYKVSAPISALGNITINGNGASIDASALEGNFIQMTAIENPTEWTAADVTVKGIAVKGLKKALFYSTNKKYIAENFIIDNCVIEQAGDATTIDYTKGSTAKNITVTNSTFYAPTATTKVFYSSQGGEKYTEYDEAGTQTFTFTNNTMYNLAPTKNFFSHRQSNQKWLKYVVKDNIFVDCGKSGQVIKGMNGGQGGANPIWDIDHNSFNFTVEGTITDTSASEETGDADEPVKNSVAGVVVFADAANGDFTLGDCAQYTAGIGDPRWALDKEELQEEITTATTLLGDASTDAGTPGADLKAAIEEAQNVLATATTQDEIDAAVATLKAAEDAYKTATGINAISVDGVAGDIFSDGKPVYNLSGQRVFKGYKGIVIKNGRKVVIK